METEPQSDRRKMAYALAKQLGLSREERHELAEFILKRDVRSWNELSDSQMERLADGLNVTVCVATLISQRP